MVSMAIVKMTFFSHVTEPKAMAATVMAMNSLIGAITWTILTAVTPYADATCNNDQYSSCQKAAIDGTLSTLAGGGTCQSKPYIQFTHVCSVKNYMPTVDYCCCSMPAEGDRPAVDRRDDPASEAKSGGGSNVGKERRGDSTATAARLVAATDDDGFNLVMCCRYHQDWNNFRCAEPDDIVHAKPLASTSPESILSTELFIASITIGSLVAVILCVVCFVKCCCYRYEGAAQLWCCDYCNQESAADTSLSSQREWIKPAVKPVGQTGLGEQLFSEDDAGSFYDSCSQYRHLHRGSVPVHHHHHIPAQCPIIQPPEAHLGCVTSMAFCGDGDVTGTCYEPQDVISGAGFYYDRPPTVCSCSGGSSAGGVGCPALCGLQRRQGYGNSWCTCSQQLCSVGTGVVGGVGRTGCNRRSSFYRRQQQQQMAASRGSSSYSRLSRRNSRSRSSSNSAGRPIVPGYYVSHESMPTDHEASFVDVFEDDDKDEKTGADTATGRTHQYQLICFGTDNDMERKKLDVIDGPCTGLLQWQAILLPPTSGASKTSAGPAATLMCLAQKSTTVVNVKSAAAEVRDVSNTDPVVPAITFEVQATAPPSEQTQLSIDETVEPTTETGSSLTTTNDDKT